CLQRGAAHLRKPAVFTPVLCYNNFIESLRAFLQATSSAVTTMENYGQLRKESKDVTNYEFD
ncbi:MAG: hypothetical protein RR918_05905, partial [Anaerovoracaceae bacterium]